MKEFSCCARLFGVLAIERSGAFRGVYHVLHGALSDLANASVMVLWAGEKPRLGTLTATLPPQVPTVLADLGLIERVLTNLLDNALRHTPAGGAVRRATAPPCRGRARPAA